MAWYNDAVIFEVHIPRPVTTLAIIGGSAFVFAFLLNDAGNVTADLTAAGGEGTVPQMQVHQAEMSLRQARIERDVLERKEEILRYQLSVLEEDRKRMRANMTPQLLEEYKRTHAKLLDLLRDKQEAELHILSTLRELWEAEVRGSMIGRAPDGHGTLSWPIEPKYGISAVFQDDGYHKRFGIPHNAVDLPALQGTEVIAAADGIVEEVADNGLGYNYLIIRHEGMGLATLYGHVEEFLVFEGQQVSRGEAIARSGGRPGSPGAGAISTGPHLHFEVITGGQRVDPLIYLEERSVPSAS